MKKTLSSRVRTEVVGPEVCHGFTTDVVKAALRNNIPPKPQGMTRSIQV